MSTKQNIVYKYRSSDLYKVGGIIAYGSVSLEQNGAKTNEQAKKAVLPKCPQKFPELTPTDIYDSVGQFNDNFTAVFADADYSFKDCEQDLESD